MEKSILAKANALQYQVEQIKRYRKEASKAAGTMVRMEFIYERGGFVTAGVDRSDDPRAEFTEAKEVENQCAVIISEFYEKTLKSYLDFLDKEQARLEKEFSEL